MQTNIYNHLIEGNQKYGSSEEEICESNFKCSASEIQEKVIIAPTWEVNLFSEHADNIKHIAGTRKFDNVVSEITVGNNKATFITTNVGACRVFDTVLALKCTPCKEILFLGSVGALDTTMKIGDIIIPEYSVCGVGVNRYLTTKSVSLNDCYGTKHYPDAKLSIKVWQATDETIKNTDITAHIGKTFSVDTIFAQFAHLDEIIDIGCNTIEMETSTVFHTADIAGIKAAAIFNVSDNTVVNKSLYSGRTEEDQQRRLTVKTSIIPIIALKTLGMI